MYTSSSLGSAANALISRNLVTQKTDIATYAQRQNAEDNPDDISRQPPPKTRGRGRGRGGSGGGSRGRGGSRSRSSAINVDGEMEWNDTKTGNKRTRSLGDQILEMQAKKLKAEYPLLSIFIFRSEIRANDKMNSNTAVESERSQMLFTLNIEQYTCILRQQTILRYVSTRVLISTILFNRLILLQQRFLFLFSLNMVILEMLILNQLPLSQVVMFIITSVTPQPGVSSFDILLF